MTIRRIAGMPGAVLLAGLAGTAFAQGTSHASVAKSGAGGDAMFMRHAAADGLAEIQLGRVALERASSAQVRELAQRIVDDHTKANDRLMSIAERQQVTLPTEPMPMDKKKARELEAKSGAAFDRAYAQAMVKDHRKAIRVFGGESRKAASENVRQFAAATLPVLKTHLQLAEQAAGPGIHEGESRRVGPPASMPVDRGGSTGTPASADSAH